MFLRSLRSKAMETGRSGHAKSRSVCSLDSRHAGHAASLQLSSSNWVGNNGEISYTIHFQKKE